MRPPENPSSRPSPLPKGRRRSFPAFRSGQAVIDSLQRDDPHSLAPSDGERV
jgi:hypothetical protein